MLVDNRLVEVIAGVCLLPSGIVGMCVNASVRVWLRGCGTRSLCLQCRCQRSRLVPWSPWGIVALESVGI
jgi:hypothetical protein